jgi:DNA-binding response OmpR family regulator
VKTARILLIEDDRDSAEAIRTLLEIDGFNVTWAGTAREAIDCFKDTRLGERRPDLILLDLMLQDMDGVMLLKEIAEIGTPPPVIVHSAASENAIGSAAEQVGAVGVLRKPTEGSPLRELLRSVLTQFHVRVA